MKRLSLSIRGKVQGVYYRASTQAKAQELGLTGFVQNEADGSVYAEAQGAASLLSELVAWCQRGPAAAVVTTVETEELEVVAETGFEIRR